MPLWIRSNWHGYRYLGVTIVRSRTFKCSLNHAKKSFYRFANSIFGKVGRTAPEEVVLQLVTTKCIPLLVYDKEACPLLKSDLSSLDFTMNRYFMKLFESNNMEIITYCQQQFSFDLPSVLWAKRVSTFNLKFDNTYNLFSRLCSRL